MSKEESMQMGKYIICICSAAAIDNVWVSRCQQQLKCGKYFQFLKQLATSLNSKFHFQLLFDENKSWKNVDETENVIELIFTWKYFRMTVLSLIIYYITLFSHLRVSAGGHHFEPDVAEGVEDDDWVGLQI